MEDIGMDTPTVTQSRKPVGRPRGEPSTVFNIRLPGALVEKLDRYCDRVSIQAGPLANRATITRQARREFLERHAPDLL